MLWFCYGGLPGLFALLSFRPAAEGVVLDVLPFLANSLQYWMCIFRTVLLLSQASCGPWEKISWVAMQKQHRDGEVRYRIFAGKLNPTLDRKRKCFPCVF